MILLSLLVLLVTRWCWYRWTNRRIYSFASKLPTFSPPPLPIIGQVYMLAFGYKWVKKRIMEVFFREGPSGKLRTFVLWLPSPLIYFRGREDIQKILNNSSSMDKSDKADLGKCILGDGILVASGETWKIKRRYYQYLFQARNVEALVPIFNTNCKKLVSKLSENTGQNSVDVFPFLVTTSLTSVCNLIYGEGIEFDPESESYKNLAYAVTRTPEIAVERQDYPWLRYEFIFKIIYGKELKYLKNIFNTFNTIYSKEADNRRSRIQVESVDVDESGSESEYINCLKVYNNMKKEHPEILKDNDFITEAINFYLAGTDTIANSVSVGLMLLGQDQNVQDKLFKEIMSKLNVKSDVTREDILQLPYLDQVFKETLRWSNTIPLMLRKATKDIELNSFTVPAGSSLIVSISGLNCDPETFPDPRKFDPDRFSAENRLQSNKYDFLPFSAGPRNCLGKIYSDILAKMIFIHVVRNFKITTTMDVNNIKWKYAVVLTSAEGCHISLERRSVS